MCHSQNILRNKSSPSKSGVRIIQHIHILSTGTGTTNAILVTHETEGDKPQDFEYTGKHAKAVYKAYVSDLVCVLPIELYELGWC